MSLISVYFHLLRASTKCWVWRHTHLTPEFWRLKQEGSVIRANWLCSETLLNNKIISQILVLSAMFQYLICENILILHYIGWHYVIFIHVDSIYMTLQGCYHIALIFFTFLLISFAFLVFLSSTFMHSLSMLLCVCMSLCLHINNSMNTIKTVYRSVSLTLI